MSFRHLKATIQRQEKAKERFQLINNNSDVCNIYYDLIITNHFGPTVPLTPSLPVSLILFVLFQL